MKDPGSKTDGDDMPCLGLTYCLNLFDGRNPASLNIICESLAKTREDSLNWGQDFGHTQSWTSCKYC